MDSISPYDLILIDFDGTLADTGKVIIACIRETFAHFGATPPSPEKARSVIGMNLTLGMLALRPELTQEQAEAWTKQYREFYWGQGLEMTTLFPGVLETLDAIERARGNGGNPALAVLSNKNQQVLEASLDKVGLGNRFALVSGDREGRRNKPDPELFSQDILPVFSGVEPAKVLVVGDGEQDTGFAHNLGAECCWASFGMGDRERCLAHAPKYVIDSFAELKDIVLP